MTLSRSICDYTYDVRICMQDLNSDGSVSLKEFTDFIFLYRSDLSVDYVKKVYVSLDDDDNEGDGREGKGGGG